MAQPKGKIYPPIGHILRNPTKTQHCDNITFTLRLLVLCYCWISVAKSCFILVKIILEHFKNS